MRQELVGITDEDPPVEGRSASSRRAMSVRDSRSLVDDDDLAGSRASWRTRPRASGLHPSNRCRVEVQLPQAIRVVDVLADSEPIRGSV
jgi:hypothetical protein